MNPKMMQTLHLTEGSLLNLKSTTLPLGKFIKIQPQSTNFLSIHDPKAVLEMSLRNFSALTKGDIIQISYNSQIYEIAVLECKAHTVDDANAVCVVEVDLEVDFAPPVGYIEPPVSSSATSSRPASRMTGTGTPGLPNDILSIHGGMATKLDFHALSSAADTVSESAFSRGGQTLRGKPTTSSPLASLSISQGDVSSSIRTTKSYLEGGPVPRPFKVKFGQFFVGYPIVPVKTEGEGEDPEETASENFKGAGVRLKDATKTKKRSRRDKDKGVSSSGTGSSLRDVIQLD
jgi:ubiquitin fusion degradation protein 1